MFGFFSFVVDGYQVLSNIILDRNLGYYIKWWFTLFAVRHFQLLSYRDPVYLVT